MGSSTKDLPEIHEGTRLNINHKVKVVLTSRGLEVLRAKVLELDFSRLSTSDACMADKAINVRYLRDGFYVFHMYEFMAIFGPSLPTFATMDAHYYLFEGNDLILLPNDF